jgi:flavorubredoxin
MRQMFPLVSAGVAKVLPAEELRWISFGHVEADESGSMNDWLAIAPQATVAQSEIGCVVSIADLANRPPRPLADGEKLDIGGHIVQWFDTPHVPHACFEALG